MSVYILFSYILHAHSKTFVISKRCKPWVVELVTSFWPLKLFYLLHPARPTLVSLFSARLSLQTHPLPLISAIYLKMAVQGGRLQDDLMDYWNNPARWHTSLLCTTLTEVWNTRAEHSKKKSPNPHGTLCLVLHYLARTGSSISSVLVVQYLLCYWLVIYHHIKPHNK